MKLVIGCGGTRYDGWMMTDREALDITDARSWEAFMKANGRVSNILSEHVIEHILPHQAADAASYMHNCLLPGGMARIAVPDGLHPEQWYIKHNSPPGCSHVAIYDYRSLAGVFLNAGFSVRLIEWWNDLRQFNAIPWHPAEGHITRAWKTDHRNGDGKPNFTSLIIDCFKA